MNKQARAFRISVFLHAMIVAAVVAGSTFMGQGKQMPKVMVLDFDLLKPAAEVQNVEAAAPVRKAAPVQPAVHKSKKRKELPPSMMKTLPDPEIPPAAYRPEVRNQAISPPEPAVPAPVESAVVDTPVMTGDTREGSGSPAAAEREDGGKEAARTKYFSEHFAYIRDRILGNVHYPDTARRMGWQGKVVLSFIITADGSVRALKVLQSSGFSLLDRDAMETVRGAAPFPRPPGEAQLVFPVIYRLR